MVFETPKHAYANKTKNLTVAFCEFWLIAKSVLNKEGKFTAPPLFNGP